MSPTTLTVNEGEETTYTIVLDSQPAGDVTVAIHDPADNSDVTPEPGNLLFYTSTWNVPQQVKVYADWDDDRDNETVTITHSASGGGYDGASIGDVTITVSDAAPPTPTGVALTVTPDEVSEAAGTTTVAVTASLQGDGALAGETTVTLTLSGGSGSGYTAGALPTITIGAGESSGTAEFTLTPTDDAVVEGGETITLSGAHSGGLLVSGATITLTDDDRATLTIGGPSDAVDEGSDAEFTVTLSAEVAGEVSVAWTASGDGGSEDYSPTSGTATFSAGSAAGATRTIAIAVTDDNLSESAETFTVSLGDVGGDLAGSVSVDGDSGSATADIAASDPITVALSGPATVDEGHTATYTVALSPAGVTPSADLTVDYASADGTATAGEDYEAAFGTLTFTQDNPGPQTVTVAATQDKVDESGESFSFSLANAAGGGGATPAISGSPVTTTISAAPTGEGFKTLRDTPTLTLINTLPGLEGQGAELNFRMNVASTSALTISYTVEADGDANTPDADAADFSSISSLPFTGEATLEAQKISGTISIEINQDTDIEPAREYFKVTLNPPGVDAGYQLGTGMATMQVIAIHEGVCDRSLQVSKALMDTTNIPVCSDVTSTALGSVTTLDLSGKMIATLKPKDFSNLSSLQTLELNNNAISALDAGIFNDPSALTTLTLDNNQLASLPSDDSSSIFTGLTTLRTLTLDHNQLASLPRNLFGGYGHHLQFTDNTHADARTNPLTSLQSLSLGNNLITALDANLFRGLTGLQTLLLNHNQITQTGLPVTVLCGLSALSKLDLIANDLAGLPANLFADCAAAYTSTVSR